MSKSSEIRLDILKELLHSERMTRREFIATKEYRAATVQEAVNQLKKKGAVVEPERTGRRTGRRSPEICLNPTLGAFIGIELRSHSLLGCVIDTRGAMLSQASLAFPKGLTADSARDAMTAMLKRLNHGRTASWPAPLGVGFADPGLVNIEQQRSVRAVHVPGWKNIDTAAWLRELTGLASVYLVPENMGRTFAEYCCRLPNPPRSLFHIGLNASIGGGFIKEGELFEGDCGMAMEIGHLVVDPQGRHCQCGNRGCLEAVAGENGIRCTVDDLRARGVRTELTPESLTLSNFVETVQQRDRAALLLASEVCGSIASALAVVVTLLNPSEIVISGELAGLGDMLMDSIRQTMSLHCLPEVLDPLVLSFSTLDDFAAAYGAALLTRNRTILQCA